MRTVLALMNRNRKLFFKDKGMLFTSMITPVILIVLYATFLAKVFRDSFTAAIPDMITISDKLINGTVAAQLTASLPLLFNVRSIHFYPQYTRSFFVFNNVFAFSIFILAIASRLLVPPTYIGVHISKIRS